MGNEILDPAYGFTSSLDDFLFNQQALKHNAMMDQLAQDREKRISQSDQLDLELRREELKQRREESQEKVKDKRIDHFLKARSDLAPGDVPNADLVKEGEALGMPLRLGAAPTIPPGQSSVAMPGGGPSVQMPGAQPSQAFNSARPYQGSRADLARGQLADLMEAGADTRTKIVPAALRLGMDPKDITGITTAEMGPNQRPTSESAFVAKGPDGKVIPGLVSMGPTGQPMLNGQPLPPGVTVERAPAPRDPLLDALTRKQIEDGGGQPHFQLQPELDATGKPTGKFYGYNTKTNRFEVVPGATPSATKAPPGATQNAQKDMNKQSALGATGRLKSDLELADKAGLIGPAAGRAYTAFAKFGTTGDKEKDHIIGQLKGDILLTKMHVDAGIGGTRAASSPLLLKNWEDIAMSGSKDLLLGYVSAIEGDMTGSQGSTAPSSKYKVTIK